jgi:hypothetical protein
MIMLLLALAGLTRGWAHDPAEDMAHAARDFLDALKPEQRAKAMYALKDEERLNWHFFPKDRKGMPLKEMTPDQRRAALALLRSGLSEHGFRKATNIMNLEAILRDIEGAGAQFARDSELYFVTLFGQPEPKGTWGWRVEGHHLSVNFTLVKGQFFSGTPSFLGSNPAEVKAGPRRGLRVLAAEEDLGRQLVKSLNPEQRRKAVISAKAPADIITGANRSVSPLEWAGLPAAEMTTDQSAMLMTLIREYMHRHRAELAEADLRKIQSAGVGKIHFAWAGGLDAGQGHYYRVQGPSFLLEYDNTQNNANHIHAVWRDFENDFGEDLLRRHYEQTPHP